MADYANRSRRAVDVTVGQFAWLSTTYLRLPAKLSRKLAAKWAGPFKVVQQVGAVSFRLELLAGWLAGWLAPSSCFSRQLTQTGYWLLW